MAITNVSTQTTNTDTPTNSATLIMKPNAPNTFIVTPESISQAISLETGKDVQARLKAAKKELNGLDDRIDALMHSDTGSFQICAQLREMHHQYAFLCGEIKGLKRALGLK